MSLILTEKILNLSLKILLIMKNLKILKNKQFITNNLFKYGSSRIFRKTLIDNTKKLQVSLNCFLEN